jgi:hypothetical protein
MEELELSNTDGNIKWHDYCEKQFDSFFKDLDICTLHDSAILLLGIYPREKRAFCLLLTVLKARIHNQGARKFNIE